MTAHIYNCDTCKEAFTEEYVASRGSLDSAVCGHHGCTGTLTMRDVFVVTPDVSVEEDKLDELIESSSTPNLAALFRQGKQAGTIVPVQAYGFTKA